MLRNQNIYFKGEQCWIAFTRRTLSISHVHTLIAFAGCIQNFPGAPQYLQCWKGWSWNQPAHGWIQKMEMTGAVRGKYSINHLLEIKESYSSLKVIALLFNPYRRCGTWAISYMFAYWTLYCYLHLNTTR